MGKSWILRSLRKKNKYIWLSTPWVPSFPWSPSRSPALLKVYSFFNNVNFIFSCRNKLRWTASVGSVASSAPPFSLSAFPKSPMDKVGHCFILKSVIFRRIVEIELSRVEISFWRKSETRRCLNFGSEETRNAPDERDGKIMKERKTDAAWIEMATTYLRISFPESRNKIDRNYIFLACVHYD